jgi:hypothetical protein
VRDLASSLGDELPPLDQASIEGADDPVAARGGESWGRNSRWLPLCNVNRICTTPANPANGVAPAADPAGRPGFPYRLAID